MHILELYVYMVQFQDQVYLASRGDGDVSSDSVYNYGHLMKEHDLDRLIVFRTGVFVLTYKFRGV